MEQLTDIWNALTHLQQGVVLVAGIIALEIGHVWYERREKRAKRR